VGRRYAQVFAALRTDAGAARPGYDAITRFDVGAGGRDDTYVYGPDVMVEEHLFVPRRAAGGAVREGDGWLVGTALDLKRQAMLLSVFDARRLRAGPVAQAVMPRVMPLGLHGTFVAA
jgi:all-trans-8'-apo-beta-carotenal 15,15'-oxygenase